MNRVVVRRPLGARPVPAAHRSTSGRAWHRHRLRRPPQQRRLRPGHGPCRGRSGDPVDAVRPPRPDAAAGVRRHRARCCRRRHGHRQPQPSAGQRLQGVPRRRLADRPAARQQHLRRDRSSPADVPVSAADDALIETLGDSVLEAYLDAIPPATVRRRTVSPTPRCTASVASAARRVRACRPAGTPRRRRAVPARSDVPDRVVPEPRGTGRDGSPARAGRRASTPTSRSPTIPMPIGSAPPSRRLRAGGVASAATSSAGCSPITSCRRHRATTDSSSRRSCRRRCSARWRRRTACTTPRPSPGSSGSPGRCSTTLISGSCSATSRPSATSWRRDRSTRTASAPP